MAKLVRNPPCELYTFCALTCFVFQQQQNLRWRFCTSKLHLAPPVALAVVRSKVMVLLLLIRCWLLLPLWDSVIVPCFVVCCFVSIQVLQSSWWGRNSWLHVFLLMPCGHLLGKGWPLGSRLWCLIVTLPLSHWYPGSGVVLDCIYSWSLPLSYFGYTIFALLTRHLITRIRF